MGFQLFPDESDHETAAMLIEYRNILVHNHGIIGGISVKRFPTWRDRLGQRLVLSADDAEEYRTFLSNAGVDVDVRAVEKFGLTAAELPVDVLDELPEKGGAAEAST